MEQSQAQKLLLNKIKITKQINLYGKKNSRNLI